MGVGGTSTPHSRSLARIVLRAGRTAGNLSCALAVILVTSVALFWLVAGPNMTILFDAYVEEPHKMGSNLADASHRSDDIGSDTDAGGGSSRPKNFEIGIHTEQFPSLADKQLPSCLDETREFMGESTDFTEWEREKQAMQMQAWQKHREALREVILDNTDYCLAQCGLHRCCRGMAVAKGQNWLSVVRDNMIDWLEDDGFQDVTLVTQGTVDRVPSFNLIAQNWEGPKVTVFTILNFTDQHAIDAEQQYRYLLQSSQSWTNVKVLAYFVNVPYDYYSVKFGSFGGPQHPINTLRNVAVDHARTNFIFTLDMDFVPSKALYTKLIRIFLPRLAVIDRAALVIPHWESLLCGGKAIIPKKFEVLDRLTISGRVRPFHVETARLIPSSWVEGEREAACPEGDAAWSPGIKTTNYFRWYRESRWGVEGMYSIPTSGPLLDKYYEPFVVVRRAEVANLTLPRYKEEYVGRYKNKISFITSLRAYRYKFFGMRREYIVHAPHPVSNASNPDMLGHLELMRRLHQHDRENLHYNVYDPRGPNHIPPPEDTKLDDGFACRMQGEELSRDDPDDLS